MSELGLRGAGTGQQQRVWAYTLPHDLRTMPVDTTRTPGRDPYGYAVSDAQNALENHSS